MESFYDDDFEEFNNNYELEDEILEMEEMLPEDGLVLHVLDKAGNIEDIIMGCKNIKNYISKLE